MKQFAPGIVFLLFVFCLNGCAAQSKKPIFCYWGTWSHYRVSNGQFRVENIDSNLCTHLLYSFFGVTTNGGVRLLDEWLDIGLNNIKHVINLKAKHPHLKILASIGGFNEGSYRFSQIAKSSSTRDAFAQNVLNFVNQYGFDGADIDWEWPGQRDGDSRVDKANFNLLLQSLSNRLKPQGKLLTIATSAAESSVAISYDIPNISKHVDFILVMSYDFHGTWDGVTGLNAPLYAGPHDTSTYSKTLNVHASISYFLAQGAPASKLVMGMPLYGRTFQLSDRLWRGVDAPIRGGGRQGPYTLTSGFLGYNEICELQLTTPMTRVWENTQKAPYAYYDDQWITYDDVESIQLKTEYAKSRNLGGVMVWSIETDDFRGNCGRGRFPLLTAIHNTWNSGQVQPITSTTSKPSTTTQRATTTTQRAMTTTQRATTTTQRATTTTQSPGGTVPICQSWKNIRNPNDCSTYYACAGIGLPYVIMSCSSGLYYNEKIDGCDWPWAVAC